MKQFIFLIFLCLSCSIATYAQDMGKMKVHTSSGVAEYLLSSLDSVVVDTSYHPCLFLKKGEESIIEDAISKSTLLASVHKAILSDCAPILRTTASTYVVTGGRLLDVSEEVFRRVFLMAYAYRMTGNSTYAARAEKEMLAAASFQDWHPSHWLDTATLLAAMGIGYDWLYDYLSEGSKEIIRTAIIEKGLNQTSKGGFYYNDNNWNSVCNGGIVVACTAIKDTHPSLTKELIAKSVASSPKVLTMYAPDGGYPEGYGYWGYGTTYQCLMSMALECGYGTDYGLKDYTGFMESARFRQFMTSPTGKCFNFADCGEKAYLSPIVFWMAYEKNDPSLLSVEAYYLKSTIPYSAGEIFKPLIMIYGSRFDLTTVPENTERFWYNGGITPIYVYRSGWTSTSDTYLGIKGGQAKSNHAHMDGGSFCYEYGGIRWSKDLGLQSYSTLEPYVSLWNMVDGSTRWDVFRLGNSSHSTLTINDKHHKVAGTVYFMDKYMTDEKQGAKVNMTTLYPEDVDLIIRDVDLENNILTISDSIAAKSGVDCEIQWIMNTDATSEVESDSTMLLTCNKQQMRMQVKSPQAFSFLQLTNVGTKSYDATNSGYRVGLKTTFPASFRGTIKVKLIPVL